MKEIFLLVDGNSLMHRAFHALPLMDADGVYTNAIYGFFSMLLKVIREENVQYLAVCFDEHAPTFRHTVYAEYKAGRSATPPELRQQFDTVRTLLDDLGIRRFSMQGWEADDLLGTLSRIGAEAGVTPLLLTGDRDALQLVGNGTELMFTRKGISETIRFDASKVYEEYGFTPQQVTDWKGLAGDSSDNIPGVPGVGDKTAVKLLQEYGTLEEVLANAGNVKGKLGEKLAAFAEQAAGGILPGRVRAAGPEEGDPGTAEAEAVQPDQTDRRGSGRRRGDGPPGGRDRCSFCEIRIQSGGAAGYARADPGLDRGARGKRTAVPVGG